MHPRLVDELAPAARDAPVEDLLTVMSERGVDRAVLVPLGPEDEYLREVLERHHRRFVGVAVADGRDQGRAPGVDPVAWLRRRREQTPFRALRTGWLGEPGRPIADSPMLPVLRFLASGGVTLWFYGPPEQLAILEEVVDVVPDLVVVLNHMGFCPTSMRVDEHGRPRIPTPIPPPAMPRVLALAAHPQVIVMLSGQYAFSAEPFPYVDLAPVAQALADSFGASRLMWASDYPWPRDVPGYAQLLQLPRLLLPSATDAEIADVLGGTALRLFRELQEA